MRLFIFYLVLFVIIATAIGQIVIPTDEETLEESCHLPTGKAALCIPLKSCSYLQALIGNLEKPLLPDVSLLIKDSFFCSNRHNTETLNVCCPVEAIIPLTNSLPRVNDLGHCVLANQTSGSTCVLFNRCSPFTQLLKNLRRPYPPEIPKLMASSWVCGKSESGQPEVCCPNEAIIQEIPSTSSPTTPVPTDSERFASHPNRSALASSNNCGLSFVTDRIVGGENAKLGQFPWLVNIGYESSRRKGVIFSCGGTLIGVRYVLTAAHCVTKLPESLTVSVIRVGEYDLSKTEDCVDSNGIKFCSSPPQDIEIEKIIPHPLYGTLPNNLHDIALLRLKKPVEPNDFVSPICLPFNDGSEETYKSADVVTVAGWGATTRRATNPADILQFLAVSIFDFDLCQTVYKERKTELTRNNQFCAGGENGKDSCSGDSGSALMNEKDALFTIIGVVSFGPKLCGTPGVPGVYTRVRTYNDWILSNVFPG